MPQTKLIKTMEGDRRQMWEEKFIARLDGDHATKDRLTEELSDQMTPMNNVKAERRDFFADLKKGDLSSWTHSAPQGGTTTSVPPSQTRTLTDHSTYSPRAVNSAMGTSFPGSVPPLAQQCTYASSLGRSALPRSDPSLQTLEETILNLVRADVSSSEKRDRIMGAIQSRRTLSAGTSTCGSEYMPRQDLGMGRSACA